MASYTRKDWDAYKVITFFVVTIVAGATGYYWYGDWGEATALAIKMVISRQTTSAM